MLKFGIISEVDVDKGFCRVKFAERGIVSGPLPMLQKNTFSNQDEGWPDINEQVACLMDENLEHGVILGAIYSAKSMPIVKDKDVRAVTFHDGSFIKFNRSSKKLTVSCEGDVEIIKAVNVNIKASTGIKLDSDVTITGKLTVANDVVSTTGDVKAGLISLSTHTHGGVTAGTSVTGPALP